VSCRRVNIATQSIFCIFYNGCSIKFHKFSRPLTLDAYLQLSLHEKVDIFCDSGGGMFGDNLSFISDTTIAATRTQGVKLKDKFKANLIIALPSTLMTLSALFL